MNVSSRSLLAAAFAVSLALSGTASAQTNGEQAGHSMSSAKSGAPDAKFVEVASAAGLAEIDLGKLGASQGQSDAVKAFGQQMIDDHTKANDELKTIASAKSIPVATAPMASDAKAASVIGAQQGAAFDNAFKKKMVADHQNAVKLFTKESTSGKDPELKAFASETLPTIKHHLEMAQQLPTTTSSASK